MDYRNVPISELQSNPMPKPYLKSLAEANSNNKFLQFLSMLVPDSTEEGLMGVGNVGRLSKAIEGVPKNTLSDLLVNGAKAIVRYGEDFSAFGKHLVSEVGDHVIPHLKPLYDESVSLVKRLTDNPVFNAPQQEISSAATSINATRLPRTFSKAKFSPDTVNADIGGGRFDNATEFLRGKGVDNVIYDPFNRTAEHNAEAIRRLVGGQTDTATVNNVLNVIKEPWARAQTIHNAAESIKPEGLAYFLIHEGDRSGVGRATFKGWQENRKTKDYFDELMDFFGDVTTRNGLIEARNPYSKSKIGLP